MCFGFALLSIRVAIILSFIHDVDDANDPPMTDGAKYGLMATQVLDIGVGVNGLAGITFTRALTHSTGNFNRRFGMVQRSWAIGAALSHIVAGYTAELSYRYAFSLLGCVSIVPIFATILCVREPPKQFLEVLDTEPTAASAP